MTALPPPGFGAISSRFADAGDDTALDAGVTSGYPILRIKGKVWTITRGGADPHVLMRPDGDGPRNSVDLVLLQAAVPISKIFYSQYEEGAAKAPECYSNNGIVPHPNSTAKQHSNCAECPQNKWGSRITTAGKPGKACRDSKRVAVSPLGDIRNEAFGGPMLLRVPADSLKEFANYAKQMRSMGYPYYAVGTKISFDPNEAYPKLVLTPLPPLNDAQADAVMELRDGFQVKEILSEGSDMVHATPQIAPAPVAPQIAAPVTPQVTQPAPKPEVVAEAPAPTAAKTSTKTIAKQEAPANTQANAPSEKTFETTLDTTLDDLLSDAV